jgi:cell division protein FtsB
MTTEQIILAFIGVACTVLGWFARELYQATQELRRDLSALQTQIGTDYVRYDRLQDALKPLIDGIHEIKDALKSKADK